MSIVNKKALKPLIILASSFCLSFLSVQPNMVGLLIMIAAVLLWGFFIFIYTKSKPGNLSPSSKKSKIISLCASILIVAFIGTFEGGLPQKYSSSGLVSSVFLKIGINKSIGLSIINICLMAGAVPVLYCFFKYLQENDRQDLSGPDFFSSESFFCLCFFVGVVICIVLLALSFSYESNVDDAFSIQLVKRDFSRLTLLTAKDFHPPLYYYLLKIFLAVFSFTGIDELFLGKVFSVVPYVILLALCMLAYKKDKSKGASLGFTILLFASFYCTYSQSMTVRMYTWGFLFVAVTFFCAQLLIKKTSGSATAWVVLTISALMCCYTQYFAAVAAVIIYGILGLFLLIKRRKDLWKLLISGVSVVIGYLPWIRVFLKQIVDVESDKNTIHVVNNTISDYLAYFITPSYDYHIKLFLFLSFIVLLLLAVIVAVKIIGSGSGEPYIVTVAGAVLFVAVLMFGLFASAIGNPILLPRYLFMSLLPALFSVGTILSKGGKRIKTCISILLPVLIIVQNVMFCMPSIKAARETKEWRDALVGKDNPVIYVENVDFEGRIIKQITNSQVKVFVEKEYAEDYYKILKKYKKSTVDIFDKVVYGDDFKLIESNHGDYLLNEVKTNGSALVVLKHPEIIDLLSETGHIKAEKKAENGENLLYQLNYLQ